MAEEPLGEVRLRDVEDGDIGVFFEQQLEPEATRMAAFPPKDRASFAAHWVNIRADRTVVTQTVLVDDQVAGNVVSWRRSDTRLIGYWIGRRHWGRGVATRALTLFVGRVRERPLYADVAEHNVGSIRVLEKCGFRRVTDESRLAEDGIAEVVLVLEA
ncbi:GNAT family N-acetyltransferase [Sphaerisporangium corydalis]|uniref:GNAT family N-acetyltransferase n=1 Tax=Sphaerisporangium corydalis TaxID=1441875 RepID=A0ABV9EQS0_9ACTN|nr:GNAT family N-acetyltransferase [Sphaerisporangium corydalis]